MVQLAQEIATADGATLPPVRGMVGSGLALQVRGAVGHQASGTRHAADGDRQRQQLQQGCGMARGPTPTSRA
eukprot:2119650-Pyramimonas_sp.AAC.1